MDHEKEVALRRRLRDDFLFYAEHCLKIRTKSGEIKPFLLNQAQRFIHERIEQQKRETGRVRAIILKGRQQGCSTYIEGRYYWKTTNHFGLRAFILTHAIHATENLFEMVKLYHDHCPAAVKPSTEASNANELIFGKLTSGYRLGTAGNKDVGRSSTIQLLHGSETAFWPNAAQHALGIFQAVPGERHTEIIIESTANGIGNWFHQQWQLAETKATDYIPIFIPWFWQPEYVKDVPSDFKRTDEEERLMIDYDLTDYQLSWRRHKIIELSGNGTDGSKSFMQEYPCTAAEAFQTTGENSFILPDDIVRARHTEVEPYGALIVGVDAARFGDDRTSIIRRQGRKAYGLESYRKKDTMEIAGIVHRIILNEKPFRVCIDIGGVGAGVYDRLVELGHADVLIAVNFGSTPLDQKRYYNKRAEMWGELKKWLNEPPVEIPDLDSLHADLCAPTYKIDSHSRLLLEKKEDIKKRGLQSPDEGDALALCFACPPSMFIEHENKHYAKIGAELYSNYNRVNKLKRAAYSR